MILQKDFQALVQLRRLSTDSYVADPSNTMATEWIWYWKDENEIWRTYGQDVKVSEAHKIKKIHVLVAKELCLK